MNKSIPAERKTYTLTKPHTHAGKQHQPGAVLNLTASQAAFIAHKLADNGKKAKQEA